MFVVLIYIKLPLIPTEVKSSHHMRPSSGSFLSVSVLLRFSYSSGLAFVFISPILSISPNPFFTSSIVNDVYEMASGILHDCI